ncbi:zinc-dependent metalloprotease family protein [Saccharospirillum salsuginis]|uniref:Peptidase M12B domain-containing protein n=1 Tax=Saccharospirillum salsuginis TaxID=418750 RepID=A0A918KQG7_9GAMM|nr:zinc-dependent metalloprotease family protein [Saccharospirillum salsuginis]GGX72142.1 hypothetical protein GCM10007392_44450 [Saccharospirillum salsuginis]
MRYCFALIVLLATSLSSLVSASPLLTREIVIDGFPYHALLTARTSLPSALGQHQALVSGQHYDGYLLESPDSWVRLSNIDGNWTGLVFLNGQVQVVGEPGQRLQSRSVHEALGDTPASCGVEGHEHLQASRSALALPRASSLDYDTLCERQVDGQCMLSELELVFDSAFQQRYPDTHSDQALSILNMVEGYYKNALDIGFDALTIEFPNTELFSTTTDSDGFLNAIQTNRSDLDFLKNDQSLLHVVTGRDFDGSTVGIAFVGVLCSRAYGVGTTQIVGNDMPLTALTVTHELGHNFGANHDNSSCGNGFVMSSYLDDAAYNQGFSSCSQTEMRTEINSLSSPQACFNFPADATIEAEATNPTTVIAKVPFNLHYRIDLEHAYLTADSLTVTGGIDPDDGRLDRVLLSDQACTLSEDLTGYTCTLADPVSPLTLNLEATATADPARLTHEVSIQQSTGDLRETRTDNNRITTEVTVDTLSQPVDLAAAVTGADIVLNWTDPARAETGYAVRRRLDGSTGWTVLTDALPADSQTFTDTTVAFDTRYQYQVQALPADADQGSNQVTLENETPPQSRTDFVADATEDSIHLSWTDIDAFETGLRLERLREGMDIWQTLADALPADTTTYQDTTPVLEERYRYRLTAYNDTHDSAAAVSDWLGLTSNTEGSDTGSGDSGDAGDSSSSQPGNTDDGDRLGSDDKAGPGSLIWILASLLLWVARQRTDQVHERHRGRFCPPCRRTRRREKRLISGKQAAECLSNLT